MSERSLPTAERTFNNGPFNGPSITDLQLRTFNNGPFELNGIFNNGPFELNGIFNGPFNGTFNGHLTDI